MVVCVAAEMVDTVTAALTEAGETVHVIGAVEAGARGCTVSGGEEVWNSREPWEASHLA